MPAEKKFITVNGVLQRNPNYIDPNAMSSVQPAPSVADPKRALTIVSSPEDVMEATDVLSQATNQRLVLPPATASTLDIIQDEDITSKLKVADGSVLLDKVSRFFASHEIPLGLLNKLLMLMDYSLHFKVDDSGSMNSQTDSLVKNAMSDFMKRKFAAMGKTSTTAMTRWEEAEDRMHLFIDMIAFVPTKTVTISFLNRKQTLVFSRHEQTPEEFTSSAHEKISEAFRAVPRPTDLTPLHRNLSEMFSQATGKTMHYVLTDGEPSDATKTEVAALVLKRREPENNPLTFLSCTDQDEQAEWMKDIEEVACFVSELDDFSDERDEVLKDQGPAFPYSKGFWLLCNLLASINPDDLDAMDESIPFTKGTMENLMGRALSEPEYRAYFMQNTNARRFDNQYAEFSRSDVVAGQIPGVKAYRDELFRRTLAKSSYGNMVPGIPLATSASPQGMFGGGYPQAQPVAMGPAQGVPMALGYRQ